MKRNAIFSLVCDTTHTRRGWGKIAYVLPLHVPGLYGAKNSSKVRRLKMTTIVTCPRTWTNLGDCVNRSVIWSENESCLHGDKNTLTTAAKRQGISMIKNNFKS
jgi:hypothetical protein